MKKTGIVVIFLMLCLALVSCGGTSTTADLGASGESEGEIGGISSSETEQAEPVEVEAEPEPAETEPVAVVEEPKETETVSENTIRPEFKEAMDSYEVFFDEYVAFMEKYSKNSNDLSLLSDYADYMAKYADATEKMDQMEDDDLTAAELSYYIEVTARIEQKLIAAAY